MNGARRIVVLASLAVLLLGGIGSYLTRGVMEHLSFLHGRKGSWTGNTVSQGIVDQRPWQTAAALAGLAVSSEELELAREAERLADHEVDQAFSQSLRQAAASGTRQLTGDALRLQQRVAELQQTVKDDETQVAALQKSAGAGAASGVQATLAQPGDDLDVAKAQLELDQNELADSMVDLQRDSGDQTVKLQQELSARQASMKKYAAQQSNGSANQTAITEGNENQTLAGQIASWRKQRTRMQLLLQAQQLAQADVAALTADHARLEREAAATAATSAAEKAKGISNAQRVKQLQFMAGQRNILSIVDDRLGAQQQLVTLYTRWNKQVELQRHIVLHLMLLSIMAIAGIVLATMLAGWGLQLALERFSNDQRQKQTLRTILNLAAQLVGLLLVLLVIFGTPSQMPTILGLATAGLTVVFQDFILAFCGWFVLMGRNGIRVGDWVEIDSVGGEVVELGLFRTWLLETGNWTANGHPTGRRVSFLNGYAIRGMYFNFSTAGQWMWDEIKVSIPAGVESGPLIQKIREATVQATEADVKTAEEEWKRATHEEGLSQFSAAPSIDMRPAGGGVDIVVRYVTRAGVRLDTRNRLFSTILSLMQGAGEGA